MNKVVSIPEKLRLAGILSGKCDDLISKGSSCSHATLAVSRLNPLTVETSK